MRMNILDYVLVPLGMSLMAGYHVWLLYMVVKQPAKTVMGINSINRRAWVHTMMEVSPIPISFAFSISANATHIMHRYIHIMHRYIRRLDA